MRKTSTVTPATIGTRDRELLIEFPCVCGAKAVVAGFLSVVIVQVEVAVPETLGVMLVYRL
jgi:hypothetical protein